MTSQPSDRAASGVPGLDSILGGGVPRDILFLIQGPPGSGKTTFALQFLMEGARHGERCLHVSNAETPAQLRTIAASHGWSLDGIEIVDWKEGSELASDDAADYTLFPEAEVEVGESLDHLFAEIERVQPERLVIDSISGLRMLAPTQAYYRRQLKRIRDMLAARRCTALVVDDASLGQSDARTQTLAHGLLELDQVAFRYGSDRRRLRVRKLRGSGYQGGEHEFTIEAGGAMVFPRLVASEHALVLDGEPASSGIQPLDALAGGGLERGSSTILLGPAGSGKSTLASVYLHAAASRGERSAIYLFDERPEVFLRRSAGLGLDLARAVADGRVLMNHLDPAELSPSAISHRLVAQVEQEQAHLVVIDSLNGYLHSAAEEPMVLLHLRELISYLSRRGVVALLTLTEHGIVGPQITTPLDASFLADNVFLLRYFETRGSVRLAVSMVKRRGGPHERAIRELRLDEGTVRLSEPLRSFSGVLRGFPVAAGPDAPESA